MRKWIILASLSLSTCFAFALANADDQQAGMEGKDQVAGRADTCVNEAGVTLNKGDAGFDDCIKMREKAQPSEQMGGEKSKSKEKSSDTMSEESY